MNQIPMLDLKLEYEHMKKDIDSAISKCLEHQKWILGPEVKELEGKIAEYIGVTHCIGLSSGTEALVLALRALAIKLKGEEYFDKADSIITTPFTFTATGDAILRAGATPVFVDIEPAKYNIDLRQTKEVLGLHSGRVVGMIPVHLYGQACNMDEIMQMAKEYNLFVVEDVAQAFGGKWKGKNLGSIGTAGTFSFFPSKNLGGFGDGGMIATKDDEIAELVRMLLKHGGRDKYNVDHIGYNARLDTIQAAVILAKFKYIDEFNDRRIQIAGYYNNGLEGMDGISLPIPLDHDSHVYHQYTIRIKDERRNDLQRFLNENGISTMIYYPIPLHKMKAFDGRCKVFTQLEESERAAKEVLSLPIEPLMSEKDALRVVDHIRAFFATDNVEKKL